jgi:hypothetical protein
VLGIGTFALALAPDGGDRPLRVADASVLLPARVREAKRVRDLLGHGPRWARSTHPARNGVRQCAQTQERSALLGGPGRLVPECGGILKFMKDTTRRLWEQQDRRPGDRLRLFGAVAEFMGDTPVLYPGSFVDVAASFVFDNVTYIDSDRRAARFFADAAGVDEIVDHHRRRPIAATWRFISADYRTELEMAFVAVRGVGARCRRSSCVGCLVFGAVEAQVGVG